VKNKINWYPAAKVIIKNKSGLLFETQGIYVKYYLSIILNKNKFTFGITRQKI